MRNPCPPPAQLLSWIDGVAPPEEAERTAIHTSGCRTCADRIALMRSSLDGGPPVQTALESGFNATVRQGSRPAVPPVSPLPLPVPPVQMQMQVQAPTAPAVSRPLGLDMAPTTPFLRTPEEFMEATGGGTGSPTRDLRGPGKEPARQAEALAPGDTLGRFVVLARQGSGGMGVVYAAYDPELDRKVALKILRSDYDRSLTAELRTRLLREAQAMARLSHPNVIPVYDVGTVGAQVFLAMEFVEGSTLTRHQRAIPRDRSQWRAVVSLYLQAGHGLAAAHAAGLIHRDFKPDNVLVSRDGKQVRVVDFGLARPEAMGAEPDLSDELPSPPRPSERPSEGRQPGSKPVLETPLTQAGMLVGTPAYMSPEQLSGRAVDARTDQFSFCVALWEALHGERPFKGTNAKEIAQAIQGGKPTGPPGAKVPAHLRRLLLRGLAGDPDRRYPGMEALLGERPFKGASAMEIAHAIETGKPTGPANAKVPSWLRKILVRGLAADP
ncbi:MAG TPA: serine/threonine-protein kinase, partial [Myxococcaceae bacterium]